ncbi:MAG: PASTA domain-containing protein, partial [Candidatus Hydrogenedentes bacterium]|nr:PASTA domain-containing protein [Candidatus Hydrogenedentota bacterium]
MSHVELKHILICFSALLVLVIAGCLRTVPDVTGMQESEAVGVVSAAGFTVGTVAREVSPTVTAGRVIRQDPLGGSQLEEGSGINLVVSLGPEPVQVNVPVLTGLSRTGAEAALV